MESLIDSKIKISNCDTCNTTGITSSIASKSTLRFDSGNQFEKTQKSPKSNNEKANFLKPVVINNFIKASKKSDPLPLIEDSRRAADATSSERSYCLR